MKTSTLTQPGVMLAHRQTHAADALAHLLEEILTRAVHGRGLCNIRDSGDTVGKLNTLIDSVQESFEAIGALCDYGLNAVGSTSDNVGEPVSRLLARSTQEQFAALAGDAR